MTDKQQDHSKALQSGRITQAEIDGTVEETKIQRQRREREQRK